MPKFTLNRRTLLRGAGTVAIALPWLEAMTPEAARAASLPARRLLTVFTPGGTVLENWLPTGSENDFVLSPILAPLSNRQKDLIVLRGLRLGPDGTGDQNQEGMVGLLTGRKQPTGSGSFPSGPSLDQVLVKRLSAGKALPSLELALRWATGSSKCLPTPYSVLNFADATFAPITPQLDPVATWKKLFGNVPASQSPDAWDASILDATRTRFSALRDKLGGADRKRIEAHLDALRDLEKDLATIVRCAPPTLTDVSAYDPAACLERTAIYPETDAEIPRVLKLMTDMMVMAFACDLTGVGTLQWSDAMAFYSLPWLDLPESHAYYAGGNGYDKAACTQIGTWYAQSYAYLLESMAAVDMGGHSLLDESIVFFGAHLQNPANHQKTDMPFLLAGGGGGLRTGRYIDCGMRRHNDLLVSIANSCGEAITSFGDAAFNAGALPNLV